MSGSVRVRFAPSPTGHLHVGGARSALFNWLFARHHRGTYVLRIEDTDRSRSTEEYTQALEEALRWLGLPWDEGPPTPGYRQTERFDVYREHAERLLAAGRAYRCRCTPETLEALRKEAEARKTTFRYPGTCRDANVPASEPHALRLAIPREGETVIHDVVRGDVVVSHAELDDWILVRTDGTPTYNFCVVVDDVTMKITHVIRGNDHLSNTPKQVLCYEALDYPVPAFAHVSLILGADRARLSKRHGATSVQAYREQGILPEALVNYLVRLGWSHGDQEIFSREQMIELFDAADVNKSASRFDLEKLSWLNQQYLKSDDPLELAPHFEWQLRAAGIDPALGPDPVDVIVALRDRARTLKEMAEKAKVWYQPLADYDEQAVAKHLRTPTARAALEAAHAQFAGLAEWKVEGIHAAIEAAAAAIGEGMGKVAQPLRVALTGTQVSPSIDHTVFLAGRDEALRRIDAAIGRTG